MLSVTDRIMPADLSDPMPPGDDLQSWRRALIADDPDVRGEAANALLAHGYAAEAVVGFRAALDGDPGRRDWRRGLIRALRDSGAVAEALSLCRDVLRTQSDDAALHRLMAGLLLETGDSAGSLDHAREARFLAPHDLAGLAEVADMLVRAEEPVQAAELLEPALRHAHPADPARHPAQVALARAWLVLAEPEKAEAALEAALEADPDDPAGAADLLARIRSGAGGDLTPAFVRALFDRYADRFDSHLVGTLRYTAPQALRQALEGLGLSAGLHVLDAGCGTGLAGVELRPFAAWLAGFDLSPRMVEKARARHLYDELWDGELVATFRTRPDAWDLIAAADVLVYLGDLHPVLAAAAGALRPGGRFAFTLERGEEDGVRLHEGRRYVHGEAHLRRATAAAGLLLEHLQPVTPRWNKGQPVDGLLAVLRKPA